VAWPAPLECNASTALSAEVKVIDAHLNRLAYENASELREKWSMRSLPALISLGLKRRRHDRPECCSPTWPTNRLRRARRGMAETHDVVGGGLHASFRWLSSMIYFQIRKRHSTRIAPISAHRLRARRRIKLENSFARKSIRTFTRSKFC